MGSNSAPSSSEHAEHVVVAVRVARPALEQLRERALHAAHVAQRGEGDLLDRDGRARRRGRPSPAALPRGPISTTLTDLACSALGERVLEQRAGVADRVRAAALRAVQVAERDVVEAVEHRDRHLLGAADGERSLALALEPAGDEGVRDQHVALVRLRGGERPPHAGGGDALLVVDVRARRRRRAPRPDRRTGRARDAHGAVLVVEDDGRGRLRQLAHHVQPALAQQPPREAHAGGAVVVAGDGDDGHAEAVDQPREHVVQQADRLGGGHGAVVQVAGDDDGGRLDLPRELHELVERVGLVLREVLVVEQAPEVPVGGVDEPHGADPTTGSGRARAALPAAGSYNGRSAHLPSFQVTHERRAAVRQAPVARRASPGARVVQRRHPAPLRGGPRRRRGRARAVSRRRAHRRGRAAQPRAARDRRGAGAARRRHAVRGHVPSQGRPDPRRRARAARRPLPHGRGQVGHAAQGVPPAGHRHPGLGGRGRRRPARRAERRRHRHRLRVPGRRRLPRSAARDPRRRPGAPAHGAHPRLGARLQLAAGRPAAGHAHRPAVPASVRVPLRRVLRGAGGQDALRAGRGARRRRRLRAPAGSGPGTARSGSHRLPRDADVPAVLPRLRDGAVRRAGVGRHEPLPAGRVPVVVPPGGASRRGDAQRVPRHQRGHAGARRRGGPAGGSR